MTAPIDVEQSFRQAMASSGIITDDQIQADGKLHRFHVEGDKPGSKNGWYVIYSDAIPAGAYGDWKRDISETWCARETSSFSPQERDAFIRRMESAKAERERERKRVHAESKARAQKIWKDSKSASGSHSFLERKQIGAHGLRVHNGSLVVPLRDAAGVIHSLQYIAEDGTKRFLTGGRVSGCYFSFGKPNGVIYIAEGFSTAATVYESTNSGVATAFNAGNLEPVARALRGKYPDATLVIAGDDDHQTDGNPGRKHAIEAAKAVGGLVALPTFKNGTGTDWNDLFAAEGMQAVKQQIEAAAPPPLSNNLQAEAEYLPAPGSYPKQYPLTDSGNAEYFAHLYGECVRFNHRHKTWLVFKNHWWQPDRDGEIKRLAKAATRQRYKAAWGIQDPKQRVAESKFTIQSESRQKLEATLALAQAEKPIADSGDNWDIDPFLLGVANGVVNLGTGELRDGKSEDRISKQTGIPYDPKAKAPRWQAFLEEIFNGNQELIDFIWRAVGYSLTGNITEKCLFMCYGSGDNGKTVFLNIIRHIAGTYGRNTSFTTLELHRDSTSSHDVADLEDRRLVTASETSEYKRLNEARIKALTGADPITARHLYQNWFTFQPIAKFWLATNHLPIIRDDSPGFWGRIRAIPFTQQFIGPDADPQLEETLRNETSGILTWAIEGCMMWQEKGLEPPEIVSKATAEYREESDPLADFIADMCLIGDKYETTPGSLYKAYKRWCEDQGMKGREVISQQMFGRRMKEKFQQHHTGKIRIYTGIGLRNDLLQ